MSWYRSYLKEPSSLYSPSPPYIYPLLGEEGYRLPPAKCQHTGLPRQQARYIKGDAGRLHPSANVVSSAAFCGVAAMPKQAANAAQADTCSSSDQQEKGHVIPAGPRSLATAAAACSSHCTNSTGCQAAKNAVNQAAAGQHVAVEIQPAAAATNPCAALLPRASSEVEMQQRQSSTHRDSKQQLQCCDELLHWDECWAGPGLGRRASNSKRQNTPADELSSAATPARRQQQQSCDAIQAASVCQQQQQKPGSAMAQASGAFQQQPAVGTATQQTPAHTCPAAVAAHVIAALDHAPPGGSSYSRGIGGSSCTASQMRPSNHSGGCSQAQPTASAQRAQPAPIHTGAAAAAAAAAAVHVPKSQPHTIRWWLFGGVALAALGGGAVAAVYGVMTYMTKMVLVYSFAWKAATGVAAAEGLALGGWSCGRVRAQRASAEKSAAELAWVRQQAQQELSMLRGLLQQKETDHGNKVGGLSAANDKLNRLMQSLRAENIGLARALNQAAAERRALEAAFTLRSSQAETTAVVGIAAAHSDRIAAEVSGLARNQQQLVALVCELREDLMGLVAEQAATAAATGTAAGRTAATTAAQGANAGLSEVAAAARSRVWDVAAAVRISSSTASLHEDFKAADDGDSTNDRNSSSPQRVVAAQLDAYASLGPGRQLGSAAQTGSNEAVNEVSVHRMTSVRGGVDAALAATVAQTLQL